MTTQHHHPQLYIADGNLVISCEKDGTPTFFRVNQSYFAKYSTFVADMLTIPQGQAAEEYDGAPYVKFHEDSEVVATFLRFLYEPFFITNHLPDTESDVAFKFFDVLQFADKFIIEDLKDTILERVRKEWPRDLYEWDQRRKFWRRNARGDSTNALSYPEPASAIRVALMFDHQYPTAPILSPVMLYDLSCRDPVVDYGDPQLGRVDAYYLGLGARWSLFQGKEERKKLQVWRRQLLEHIFEELFMKSPSGCQSRSAKCAYYFKLRNFHLSRDLALKPDLLQVLRENIELTETYDEYTPIPADDACRDCLEDHLEKLRGLRANTFSRLEGWYHF